MGTRQSETLTVGSYTEEEETVEGQSCVTEIQNSDGEMFYDGVFSDDDDASSEENEGDYETDLEVDEESKIHISVIYKRGFLTTELSLIHKWSSGQRIYKISGFFFDPICTHSFCSCCSVSWLCKNKYLLIKQGFQSF